MKVSHVVSPGQPATSIATCEWRLAKLFVVALLVLRWLGLEPVALTQPSGSESDPAWKPARVQKRGH